MFANIKKLIGDIWTGHVVTKKEEVEIITLGKFFTVVQIVGTDKKHIVSNEDLLLES